MNGIPTKKINSRPQNWISLIKFVENRSKQKVRLPYCNLYAKTPAPSGERKTLDVVHISIKLYHTLRFSLLYISYTFLPTT